jgi:hypothetical protein
MPDLDALPGRAVEIRNQRAFGDRRCYQGHISEVVKEQFEIACQAPQLRVMSSDADMRSCFSRKYKTLWCSAKIRRYVLNAGNGRDIISEAA